MESYRDGIYRIKFPAPEEMSAIRVKLFTGSSGMFLGSFGQNMLLTIKIKLFYRDQEEDLFTASYQPQNIKVGYLCQTVVVRGYRLVHAAISRLYGV